MTEAFFTRQQELLEQALDAIERNVATGVRLGRCRAGRRTAKRQRIPDVNSTTG
jgi:hypothetical protein